jgi:hypothetical protein
LSANVHNNNNKKKKNGTWYSYYRDIIRYEEQRRG